MKKKYYYIGTTNAGTKFRFKTDEILLKPPIGYAEIEKISFIKYLLSDIWVDEKIKLKY